MNSPGKELIVSESAIDAKKVSLAEERTRLRQQIRTHRQVLDYQLGPEPEARRDYPRSMIMRFLAEHPALASAALGKIASLAFGARLLKSTGTAMAVLGVMKTVLNSRRDT